MQHDELIWQTINDSFCSFKVKAMKETFCKNEFNLTGLCDRRVCPLANSRYATVVEKDGKAILCIKTIERAHTPKNMWEKIELSKNYGEAIAKIDEQLAYWPDYMIHRCKQRLTKITQMLMRMRKAALSKPLNELVPINKKIDRRERNREAKAERAAKIEDAIKNELLERLRNGMYEGIANIPAKQYADVLSDEEDEDLEDDISDDEMPEDELTEYVSDYESEGDLEDMYEKEMEDELPRNTNSRLSNSNGKRKISDDLDNSVFEDNDSENDEDEEVTFNPKKFKSSTVKNKNVKISYDLPKGNKSKSRK